MGGKTPETCWAVNKRQDNKLENCCIWLVIYLNWRVTDVSRLASCPHLHAPKVFSSWTSWICRQMQQYPPKHYITENLNLHQLPWENLKYRTTLKTGSIKKQPDIRGRCAEYQSEKATENCMQIFAVGIKILMTAVKDYLFPNTRTASTFQGKMWYYWGNAYKSPVPMAAWSKM
jgi:hypothetical protein